MFFSISDSTTYNNSYLECYKKHDSFELNKNGGKVPWNSGKVKNEVITKKWTYELPHQLLNDLRLWIFVNEEVLRLFTWVFIDKMFLELVDLNSQPANLYSNLVNLNSHLWIWTCNSWKWTRNLWFWRRNSWILTRPFEFQLVLLSLWLIPRNS